MINGDFWSQVVKRWSVRKDIKTEYNHVKPVDIPLDDDEKLAGTDIDDILDDLDEFDDLFD
ncbi:hypothetical protein SAMN06297422_101162 [Lachnospiraceae bacterium]|nr:hypothetical protein SAMN06297422_101162 [Lachnospiraceae bacterium]